MRVPTSDLHATNACWSLFLLSTYLVVAEAASFDKKELMQERYTPLSREAGTATHCLLSFSSVTFTSTVVELPPMFCSPLMMGAG